MSTDAPFWDGRYQPSRSTSSEAVKLIVLWAASGGLPIKRCSEWMSTIAVPTGMKRKAAASRNAGRTSTRIAQRRTGPEAPRHDGGRGSRRPVRPTQLINTSQQIGGALGLAILASVANTRTDDAMAGAGGDPSRCPVR